jgi:hypothetical protein
MALNPDAFDFLSNLSTLWSVVLGALLATVGGLAGGQLEAFLEHRRRERDAALFFAEVLSTLKIILDLSAGAKKVGDPFGGVTMRMLRSARREIDLYERNRETLYALRRGDLRARIHTTILRLTMPLDGLFDAATAIENIGVQMRTPHLPELERKELELRLAQISDTRERAFEFLMEALQQVKPLAAELGAISGQSPDSLEQAARNG